MLTAAGKDANAVQTAYTTGDASDLATAGMTAATSVGAASGDA